MRSRSPAAEFSVGRGLEATRPCSPTPMPGPSRRPLGFPLRSGKISQGLHRPPLCPWPFPQLRSWLQFILPLLHRSTDGLCCVLQVLILFYFTGFNLMTRNPKQIKFALKSQGNQ